MAVALLATTIVVYMALGLRTAEMLAFNRCIPCTARCCLPSARNSPYTSAAGRASETLVGSSSFRDEGADGDTPHRQ